MGSEAGKPEFICIACGLRDSELPADHQSTVVSDEFGWPMMICTVAVQRPAYRVEAWGAGGHGA